MVYSKILLTLGRHQNKIFRVTFVNTHDTVQARTDSPDQSELKGNFLFSHGHKLRMRAPS